MRRAFVVCGLCFLAIHCGSSDDKATSKTTNDGGVLPDGGVLADGSSSGDDDTSSDAGADVEVVNPNPTISSFLGTNVSGDSPRNDITFQMNPFDTAAASKDAHGYPVAGASGTSQTDLGFQLATGDYTIRYRGTGTVTVGGIAKLNAPFAASGDEMKTMVHITSTPGVFGNFLTVKIANDAGQTVTDLAILVPDAPDDGATVFRSEFISLLAPFRALRFMDWEATNGSTIVNWADRPAVGNFGTSTFGQPYEHIIELANVTGKDLWITIPEHASDDFIHQFGKLLLANLDFGRIQKARDAAGFTTPFQLIVENSNETWNTGFTAYATFLDAANKDAKYTGVYDGTYASFMAGNKDLMKVGQYEADRLVNIGNIMKQELGAHASIVAPVLSGWALAATYSDVGLRYIKATYGDPSQYVSYIAHAPYFGAKDDDAASLATLFPALDTTVAGMETVWGDFKTLAATYNIKVAAYEGGQGLGGTTNQQNKHLAQHDQRMFDSYSKYFALWKKVYGNDAMFMHFSLADNGQPPEVIYQYGFWGSIVSVLEDTNACRQNLPTLTGTEMLSDVRHHCPKYAALAAQVP